MLCAIPGCKNSSRNVLKTKKRISFFSLPHDPEIRKIWLKATKRPSSKLSDYISVCSDHFEDKYIKKCCIKTMLISGAIPTLKLKKGEMDLEIESLVEDEENEKSDEPKIEKSDSITNERINLKNESTSQHTCLKENDTSDDHKNISTIEKSILNILDQLNIITDHDPDANRSHSLKSDVTKILLEYKSHVTENVARVEHDDNSSNVLEVKMENSDDDIDLVANDQYDDDSDCDLKTFKLRNEPKSVKDKSFVKKHKIKTKNSISNNYGEVPSKLSKIDNFESMNDLKMDVCEDSDDSVYNLYPMAKNFLNKMQKIKAIRKQNRKRLLTNFKEQTDKNTNHSNDGQSVIRHTCLDCDISFSSSHLLSLHPSFCKARLSKDIKLSYWAKKECPECNTKFSTKSNLRRHLIIHRLREYKSKMVEIHEKKDITSDISMPNTNITETIDTSDKSCLNRITENNDKTDIIEDVNRSDRKSTEEILFEDTKLNKVAISNILNTTHDDNSISLKFNVSSVNCVPPNSIEMNGNNLECTICEEICTSKEELIKHSKVQHPDGALPYVCNHCPNYFKTLSTLRMHVKTCHKEVSTTGGRNKYLAGKSEIANSYPKNIDFKVFACSRCAKIFLSVKDLTRHEKKGNCSVSSQFKSEKMKLHRINSKYPCQFCGKIYKTYTGLKLHILDHTKELSYSCPKCPRRFKASFHLKKHMNNIHEKKYCICEICGAKYSNIYYLKRHLLVHNNIRNFKCNYCPKAFVYKSSLKSHIRVHTQEKPWVCQYCNQAFSERRNWRIHVNEHEGLKPFKCTLCEEAFVSKRKLNKHIHDHHN